MTKIIAITNQKGGVGKTTTTVNLAYALSQRNKAVLVIDMDPQASLTIALGHDPRALEQQKKTINHTLLDNLTLASILIPGVPTLIPASINLAKVEIALVPRWNSVTALKDKVHALLANNDVGRPTFDYILIDCPPTLSLLTVNSLVAAQLVLIPVKTDYLSLMGLTLILETIEEVQRSQNPLLKILGVLPTMYKSRNSHDREALQEIHQSLEPHIKVFDAIAHSTAFDKAAVEGKSTLELSPETHGVENYYKLADYITTL